MGKTNFVYEIELWFSENIIKINVHKNKYINRNKIGEYYFDGLHHSGT